MALGAAFAALCCPNDVIGLLGVLGAGKTRFVKGLARGLGVGQEVPVVSPTFVLMRSYAGRLMLHHFDAYRLRGAAQMEDIGCAEAFEDGGVSVIEWADNVAQCLPPEHFLLSIRVTGPTARAFLLEARGAGHESRLGGFHRAMSPWQL